MCGICGIYGASKPKDSYELVKKMNKIQKHRGPDDEGIYNQDNVTLGHVRLSIIDLSNGGHQPMEYKDRSVIVFNGEIYNYIELREELRAKGYEFNTDSDTEVLLASYDCWGEDCFNKFNGFWAFAIYNRIDKSILLSRDRFGVKPLYYTFLPGYLIFSSELKTMIGSGEIKKRIANDKVVFDYLVNGFVDCSDETFIEDIFRVPSGSYMKVYEDGRKEITKYYSVQYKETLKGSVSEQDIRQFRQLFKDSIKLRLRSDVPVGSCLSGGLDSSSIVSEVSKQLDKQHAPSQLTFSACYLDRGSDESRYIDSVTNKSKTINKRVYPDGRSLMKDLDSLIYTQDEPFVSTSMYSSYCVMRLANENGVKVLLDGQGADEQLCGYRKARVYYIKRLVGAKRYIDAIRETALYVPFMFKKNTSLLADISMLYQFFGKKEKKDIRRKYLSSDFSKSELNNSYEASDRFLINDFERIVLPALLRYVDRNSMAFSIEDRLPFLDYRFVDFNMSLPMNAKIHKGYSKFIMRKALDMPKDVKRRRDKIGFYTPETKWLQDYNEQYHELFEEKDFRASKYINADLILEDWDKLLAGKDSIGLFRYICLEKWMRLFNVNSK